MMMNSNKKEDNKKYVQMSPDTVSMLAESVGISGISGGVSRALAEDVSYRCRELASVSTDDIFFILVNKFLTFPSTDLRTIDAA